jgi:nucleotide-binding universal stress UspA family protein
MPLLNPMKLLITYDGSQAAMAAIENLRCAGFPEREVEARILTIGETHSPMAEAMNLEPNVPIVTYALEHAQEYINYSREAGERDSEAARKIVATYHPHWETEAIGRVGSPASTILDMAREWTPDVIVMGSHGRSMLGRLFLGSVSMRVLAEADCSVRIVKHQETKRINAEPVVLLAFDGSETARKAVHTVMHRSWPVETVLHIVTVIDVSVIASYDYLWLAGGDLREYHNEAQTRLEHMLHSLEQEMRKHFRTVTSAVPIGSPATEILKEAKRVGADMIFVGSRGLTGLTRVLLGSTAHGLAARAEQTLEIVR